VLGVGWKANSRVIASAGADKVIKVWDFASGEQRKTIEGFGKEITSLGFLPATNEILAGSGDSQLKLLREDGGQVRAFAGSEYITSASCTPDGRNVIAGCLDGTLRVWNGLDAKLITTFSAPSAESFTALNSR
jgi:WD40 repeat protein